MTVTKISGIETEYGILVRGAVESDPFAASRLLLEHCEEAGVLRCGLAPLGSVTEANASFSSGYPNEARDLSETAYAESRVEQAVCESTVDVPSAQSRPMAVCSDSLWNLMLPNGARFYIDHAHPEYSTAEAATPHGVVAADKAGEIIVDRCRQRANLSGRLPVGQEISIYKNNSDQKGRSYGCHENYLLTAHVFEALLDRQLHRTLGALVPFLVTRVIFCGAGKVGAENGMPPAGFQLSQRADFFETLIGLQTTRHRPLVNTRDEPHADRQRFRRLHVIAGDANMAEYSTYLKVGATQLVLMMIEDDFMCFDLTLDDPIAAVQAVSRDLEFNQPLPLACGGKATAVEIQREYLTLAQRYVKEKGATEALCEVVDVWGESLDRLVKDWHGLATRLDWAIKRNLLERYLQQQGCDWEIARRWEWLIDATLGLSCRAEGEAKIAVPDMIRTVYPDRADQLSRYVQEEQLDWGDYWRQRDIYFALRRLDLEYHDISRGAASAKPGLFCRLQRSGAIERLLTDDEIESLVSVPPADTRAYLRGSCIARYADSLCHADWSEMTFCEPGRRQRWRIDLPDPRAGTRSGVESLLAECPDIATLASKIGEQQFSAECTSREEAV